MPPSSGRADSARTRQSIIDCLRDLEAQGVSPTANDLAKHCHVSKTTVRRYVKLLAADGTIEITERLVHMVVHEIRLVHREEPT